VISEGSCDTEDWNNDAENTGINDTLLYIYIENCYFKLYNISLFVLYF